MAEYTLNEKIRECYDKKLPIDNLADLMDGLATALITGNRPLAEIYLRDLPEYSRQAQAVFTTSGDRLHLKEITDAMAKAGYDGMREALEKEGKIPRGLPLRRIFAGEITLCACPCFEAPPTLFRDEF